MSKHTPTFTAESRVTPAEAERSEGFFSRLFKGMAESREAQARRYVQAHLNGLSDLRLRELGFGQDEIDGIRASKPVPVSYWI